jgi:hypothetical protein
MVEMMKVMVEMMLRTRLCLSTWGRLERCTDASFQSTFAAVLDDEERGALIHCRNHDNRWKLCRAVWEQEWDGEGEGIEAWKEFIDCPGRADLVTDGMGGVWVLKKVGKRNNKRAMSYVNRNGELIEGRGESFLGVAVMEGWVM